MTFLLRGSSIVTVKAGNGIEAEMIPGGGIMTLRTKDVTLTVSTHDMLEALLGVDHPKPEQIDFLIQLVEHQVLGEKQDLLEMLHALRANLAACMRETDWKEANE